MTYTPPALWGILMTGGKRGDRLMICGAELGAGVLDMPQAFYSRRDAQAWINCWKHEYGLTDKDAQTAKIVPLNGLAADADAKQGRLDGGHRDTGD